MSMFCRPMWPFLLMYGSHDMRHTGFPHVDGGQRDPQEMERHKTRLSLQVWIFRLSLVEICSRPQSQS